jgi:anti-sigma B factor antagonist
MGYSHPPSGVEIESCHEGGDYIIRLRGELDVAGCPELEEAIVLAERIDAARIVIDIDGLDFIDSTGLHVFLKATRRAEGNGKRLRFTSGGGHVADILRVTALDQTLPFLELDEGAVPGENDGLRKELHAATERLARQRAELRELHKVQRDLRIRHRELHRHALALEGKLADALLALEAEDRDEAKALLVQARGELAEAVSGNAGEREVVQPKGQ